LNRVDAIQTRWRNRPPWVIAHVCQNQIPMSNILGTNLNIYGSYGSMLERWGQQRGFAWCFILFHFFNYYRKARYL